MNNNAEFQSMRRSDACTRIRTRNILNPISTRMTQAEVLVNRLIDLATVLSVVVMFLLTWWMAVS